LSTIGTLVRVAIRSFCATDVAFGLRFGAGRCRVPVMRSPAVPPIAPVVSATGRQTRWLFEAEAAERPQ
jgi:hypothetical protein